MAQFIRKVEAVWTADCVTPLLVVFVCKKGKHRSETAKEVFSIACQECNLKSVRHFFSCSEGTWSDNPQGCTAKHGLDGCEHCNKDISYEDAEQVSKCLHRALLETGTASELGQSPWAKKKSYAKSMFAQRLAKASKPSASSKKSEKEEKGQKREKKADKKLAEEEEGEDD